MTGAQLVLTPTPGHAGRQPTAGGSSRRTQARTSRRQQASPATHPGTWPDRQPTGQSADQAARQGKAGLCSKQQHSQGQTRTPRTRSRGKPPHRATQNAVKLEIAAKALGSPATTVVRPAIQPSGADPPWRAVPGGPALAGPPWLLLLPGRPPAPSPLCFIGGFLLPRLPRPCVS